MFYVFFYVFIKVVSASSATIQRLSGNHKSEIDLASVTLPRLILFTIISASSAAFPNDKNMDTTLLLYRKGMWPAIPYYLLEYFLLIAPTMVSCLFPISFYTVKYLQIII